jgi:hypothetical protein
MTTMEVSMETQDIDQELDEGVRGAIEHARAGVSDAIGHVPEIAAEACDRAEQVADRLPAAFDDLRTRAQSAVTRLQTMPDSRLRLLAAASIGLGTGLRLAGASRLATLIGLAAASILGYAIVSRPGRVELASKPTRF